jgi:hypothetical protein
MNSEEILQESCKDSKKMVLLNELELGRDNRRSKAVCWL